MSKPKTKPPFITLFINIVAVLLIFLSILLTLLALEPLIKYDSTYMNKDMMRYVNYSMLQFSIFIFSFSFLLMGIAQIIYQLQQLVEKKS